jgi:hypothetical protein
LKSISITTRPRSNSNASALLDAIIAALFLTGPRLVPSDLLPFPSDSSYSASSATGIGFRSVSALQGRPPRCMGKLFCMGQSSDFSRPWSAAAAGLTRPRTIFGLNDLARPCPSNAWTGDEQRSRRRTMVLARNIGRKLPNWVTHLNRRLVGDLGPKGSATAGKLRSRKQGRRSGRRRR